MPDYLGSFNASHGPILFSPLDAAAMKKAFKSAKSTLEEHWGKYEDASDAASVTINGKKGIILPSSHATAFHPRPWGGYFVRALDYGPFEEEAAVAWSPAGIKKSAWYDTDGRLHVGKEKLHLVDCGFGFTEAKYRPSTSIPIALKPGYYFFESAEVEIADGRKYIVVRFRLGQITDAEMAAIDKDASGKLVVAEVKDERPVFAFDDKAKAAAKATKLVESECGGYLLAGEGLETYHEDYERLEGIRGTFGTVKLGKHGAITFPGQDCMRLVPHGKDILVVVDMGSDNSNHMLAVALGAASDKKTKWKTSKSTVDVGKGAKLFIVDPLLDGEKLLKKAKLPANASSIAAKSGTWVLEDAGEINALVAVGKKEHETSIHLLRLRRR